MKLILLGLVWRIITGICIAIVGILVSMVTGNWNIEYWWFGGFGVLMILLAALPFMGGRASSVGTAWFKPEAFTDEYRNSRSSLNGSMNWIITTFLIGIINLLASVLIYHIHN